MTDKTAYINGIILDGTEHMEPLEGHVIVTEGEHITGILPASDVKTGYEDAQIVDLQHRYIMPGLINMHVHLAGNGKPQKKQRDNEALVKKVMANKLTRAVAYKIVCKYAELELMGGVTTIRTVGGLADFDTRCRDDIKAGKVLGPRIIASNEGISVPGGHMAGSVAIAAKTTEEALAHLEKAKDQGIDFVKLMITGGVLDAKEPGVPGDMKMPPEMVKAVCDRAHELGFIVAAHVESSEGVRVALENGVDSIEHGAKLDDHMLQLFKDNNAFVCGTLSPAVPYAYFDRTVSNASEVEQYNGVVVMEGFIDCYKKALDNGIPVALGNDVGCPWISQYDFWRELVFFAKYIGVSNKFALHTATLRNAQLAGIGDETGSIEVGKAADMIVTDENPLEDLHTLRNVRHVVARGTFVEKPKVKRKARLDAELDKFM